MKNEVKNSANSSDNLVALRSENEKLKAENEDLKHTIEQLMEQIRLARHKRFGASSEKNTEAEQLSIFNEAEIYADVQEAEEKLTVIAGHTRRKKKSYGTEVCDGFAVIQTGMEPTRHTAYQANHVELDVDGK